MTENERLKFCNLSTETIHLLVDHKHTSQCSSSSRSYEPTVVKTLIFHNYIINKFAKNLKTHRLWSTLSLLCVESHDVTSSHCDVSDSVQRTCPLMYIVFQSCKIVAKRWF